MTVNVEKIVARVMPKIRPIIVEAIVEAAEEEEEGGEKPEVDEAEVQEAPPEPPAPPASRRPTPDERLTSRRLMRTWVVIYAFVAAQMAWVLRPLVGAPDEGFVWLELEERGGSFVQDFFQTLRAFMGG